MKTTLSILAAVIGCAWVAVSANATVRYVNVNNATPNPPYTNWTTAANVIQDAIDAALLGDEIVVADGVYETGGRSAGYGRMTNRVAVTKPVTLRSVNGPDVTVIRGHRIDSLSSTDAVRCVYLTNGVTVIGFTLTNGSTLRVGGI